MASENPFFDAPILNSPYEYPARHWELDEEGQPTQRIVEKRRVVELITPIPKPKKAEGGSKQKPLVLDEGKTVSREYGVLMSIIRLARRTTFVIDKGGVIQHIDKGGEAADPDSARQACSLLGRQSEK